MPYNSSPVSSATSSPISIGWSTPSSRSSHRPIPDAASSNGLTCAFPSWPKGSSLTFSSFHTSAPSAFISDADLFGHVSDEESDVPLLLEAPAPPRHVPFPAAAPLAPLFAQEKQKKTQRRRSSHKKRSSPRPMSPIVESPE